MLKLYPEESVQAIADAIREKNGSTDKYKIGEMAEAIGGIQGGWSTDGIATGSEPNGDVILGDIDVSPFALSNKTNIVSVSGGVKSIESSGFQDDTALESVCFPKITGNIKQNAFMRCSNLEIVDLWFPSQISMQAFANNSKLKTLILRGTSVIVLQLISAFNNTPFASNGTGGTLYVPNDLIASYQSASNWSTILGYANNQIKAIEGSIYETHYADGTPVSS